MKISDRTNRDLQLLNLLIERQLEQEGCDTSIMAAATTELKADPHREDRNDIVLQLELQKGLGVTITDTWWVERHRKVEDVCRQAAEIAGSLEALWCERASIKAMRDAVASAVRREVANARRRDIPYRMVSADICPVEAGDQQFPYVHVDLEWLGPSLVPEVMTLRFDAAEQVKPCFAEMSEKQKARRMRQVLLQHAAADGEIDEVALRFMRIQGCDVPAILAQLPHANILDVDLAGEGSRGMVLFWRDGVVHANFRLTDTMSWNDGSVTFKEAPKRFPAKPQGRLLSEFVKHEAFPEGLRIVSGYRSGEMASAGLPRRTVRFNSSTGETWAA
jgi:hypothetical protein